MFVSNCAFIVYKKFTPKKVNEKTVAALMQNAENSLTLQNEKDFELVQKKKCSRQIKSCSNGWIYFSKGRKYHGIVENGCYQHFLLFPQCFQNAV